MPHTSLNSVLIVEDDEHSGLMVAEVGIPAAVEHGGRAAIWGFIARPRHA